MNNLVALAIGSNLGNKLNNIKTALYEIELKLLKKLCTSSIFETKAMLKKNSPISWDKNFFNLVTCGELINNNLSPEALLKELEQIEIKIGKNKEDIWAPRAIDIDIIIFKDLVHKTDGLTIPHKNMHNRDFVLKPLEQIMPQWRHPILNKTVTQLASEVTEANIIKKRRFKL